jgi:hypothetical protein
MQTATDDFLLNLRKNGERRKERRESSPRPSGKQEPNAGEKQGRKKTDGGGGNSESQAGILPAPH